MFSHKVKFRMQLWFPLRGNRLCECVSLLKQSLCSLFKNQFNFTFQECSSVPAAELGQGGPRGIKKLGHRGFVSGESVFGKTPRKCFCCQTEGTAKSSRPRSLGPRHYDNRQWLKEEEVASSKYDTTRCHPPTPWEQELNISVCLTIHTRWTHSTWACG